MAARNQARWLPRHRGKDGALVRLYSRTGNDLTYRFPLIVEAIAGLRSCSVILDDEAVACDDNGMPSFDRLRHRRHDEAVWLVSQLDPNLHAERCRRE
jgi:ATP-dependent DNA ligase